MGHFRIYQDWTMGRAAQTRIFSAADYLAWETTQPERHEFLDGEVFAMAGAEDRHVTVAGNLYITLRQHLSGSACRTYMSDMRLHVAARGVWHSNSQTACTNCAPHAAVRQCFKAWPARWIVPTDAAPSFNS